jgi:P-type Ca2+ transporter type 2C
MFISRLPTPEIHSCLAQARDVNIFPPESSGREVKAFEGREFFQLPPKTQLEILKEDNIVFCRAEPADKQKLVKMLQSLREITAMTGDGKEPGVVRS